MAHSCFAVSRPFVRNVTASPTPFVPLAGQSTTLSYSLADNGSPIATVTVKVYDSQNALVRTLVSGSQATGVQSVAWDGRTDPGPSQQFLTAGAYTVKVNAIDGEGLAAPEQTLSLSLTHQASTTYDYDRLYRLTSVTAPSGPTSYEYDTVGNRTTMTRGSATSYAYDRADRIQTTGTVSYTVNNNGNLVARGPDTFVYDQANRLKSATIGSTTSTYSYDGDGKRVSATVGTNPTVTYRYDVNRSLPVVLSDGTRTYVWGLGLAYAVDGAGNVEVYHTDGLGSVRAISDASPTPQVVQTYQTDEFGVATLSQGMGSQPFQYTGEQRDGETGFVYLRARMYDPGIGRFLQRDGVAGRARKPGSLNRYIYVENNVPNRRDPAGLEPSTINIPNGPADESIDENIREAAASGNWYWWVERVKPSGDWDYKGEDLRYENFGNFNYGATGRALGFDEDTLLRAAGIVQAVTTGGGEGIPGLTGYFGDQPRDQEEIKLGMRYYDRYHAQHPELATHPSQSMTILHDVMRGVFASP